MLKSNPIQSLMRMQPLVKVSLLRQSAVCVLSRKMTSILVLTLLKKDSQAKTLRFNACRVSCLVVLLIIVTPNLIHNYTDATVCYNRIF